MPHALRLLSWVGVAAAAFAVAGCRNDAANKAAPASTTTATTALAHGDDDTIDRIVQAVAEGRDVMVTVRLEVRPGAGKETRRVHVASVEFDADGKMSKFRLLDGSVSLFLPAVAFRKVLVKGAPVTITDRHPH